jgi:hypothetical protein
MSVGHTSDTILQGYLHKRVRSGGEAHGAWVRLMVDSWHDTNALVCRANT